MATTARSHFDMPDLFTPERLNARSMSNSATFAPAPRFPSATESTGRQVIDSTVHETRKRNRHDGDLASETSTSRTHTANSWVDGSLAFSHFSDARSPPPLANDRYELAGGMERPNIFARHNTECDDYFQLQKQRGMWSTPTSPLAMIPNLADNVMQPTPNSAKPWVLNQILSLMGGVAGKVVQFCSVPFRGFQAGAGQAYTLGSQGEITSADPQDNPFNDHVSRGAPTQKPLPGEYPGDNYGVLSIESLGNERPRMSKRLRTGESWVMVDQQGEMDSRPSTPRLSERRVPNHARSPSQIPRPVSRTGNATPKRPSLIPISRRSTLDRKSFQAVSNMSSKSCSSSRSYSRQSYGSPAMFQDTSNAKKSPLPAESQRLISKMRREELEDDARLRRMSSQMNDMLREANEALGSKFEVGDDYGVSVDDGDCSQASSWYQR